jgi:hypothetical protein
MIHANYYEPEAQAARAAVASHYKPCAGCSGDICGYAAANGPATGGYIWLDADSCPHNGYCGSGYRRVVDNALLCEECA